MLKSAGVDRIYKGIMIGWEDRIPSFAFVEEVLCSTPLAHCLMGKPVSPRTMVGSVAETFLAVHCSFYVV